MAIKRELERSGGSSVSSRARPREGDPAARVHRRRRLRVRRGAGRGARRATPEPGAGARDRAQRRRHAARTSSIPQYTSLGDPRGAGPRRAAKGSTPRSSPTRTAPRRPSSPRCAAWGSRSSTSRPTSGCATCRPMSAGTARTASPTCCDGAVYGLTELNRERDRRGRAGRQPRLLPDRDPAGAGAAGRGGADRGRRRRRQVRASRAPAAAPPRRWSRQGERRRQRLQGRGPPPHAGDRPGAAGARARSGEWTARDHLRAAPAAVRPGRAGQLLRQRRPTSWTGDELRELYEERYGGEPFVELVDDSAGRERGPRHQPLPHPRRSPPRAAGRFAFAAIDNLWKGAASQAIQNLNLMLGLPEGEGIS